VSLGRSHALALGSPEGGGAVYAWGMGLNGRLVHMDPSWLSSL